MTSSTPSIQSMLESLPGPILVIGASGFLGTNLLRRILTVRTDVYGTFFSKNAWRLQDIPEANVRHLNITSAESIRNTLDTLQPAVIFDCSAYGSYSFERNTEKIHLTNYNAIVSILETMREKPFTAYIHSGSSSEYGLNCTQPKETDALEPDSAYAVSKAAASMALAYYGQKCGLPCVNMRLYSLYGPYEDSSRLIPKLAENIIRRTWPSFVNPEISRDFTYVEDAVEAYILAASKLQKHHYGHSYNIGTGVKTTIRDLATLAQSTFDMPTPPVFGTMTDRMWDHPDWYANPSRVHEDFGWKAETPLKQGLQHTVAWWETFLKTHHPEDLTKAA